MSTEELDAFRSELLRQKIIFEAELRRQRESFEERLGTVAQELAAREADCRNLQSVITVLGRKLDGIAAQVAQQAARRPQTPTRSDLLFPISSNHEDPSAGVGSRPSSARRAPLTPTSTPSKAGNTFIRRPSPLISIAGTPSAVTLAHRVSSLSALSRTSSPSRQLNGAASVDDDSAGAKATVCTPGAGSAHGQASAAGHPNGGRLRRTSVGGAGTSADTTSRMGGIRHPSPRSARGRRRSGSAKGRKGRTGSAHRLQGVKVTDDW